MKRFLSILTLTAALSACEIPFDIRQEGTPKVYVQTVVTETSARITTRFAAPVGYSGDGQLRNRHLLVSLNGTELDVEADPADPDGFSVPFPKSLQAGDRISVQIGADGVPDVSGSTVWLRTPQWTDFVYKMIPAGESMAREVRIRLDEAPGPDDYFGIQILKNTEIQYADERIETYDSYLTPGYILTEADSGGFDLEDFMQVNYDGSVLGGSSSYQPLTLLSQKQFDEAEYRFYLDSFDGSILGDITDRLPEGDTGIAGGGIVSGEAGQTPEEDENPDPDDLPVGIRYRYTIRLYRLSPDTYYYAKALFQSNFDFLANMGLTPANFTWSNIRNGLGFVGTVQECGCWYTEPEALSWPTP